MTTYTQDQLNQLASQHGLQSDPIFIGSFNDAFVCLYRGIDNPEYFQASLAWDCRRGEGPVTVRCGYYGQRMIRGDSIEGQTFESLAAAVAAIPAKFDALALEPAVAT